MYIMFHVKVNVVNDMIFQNAGFTWHRASAKSINAWHVGFSQQTTY